MNLKYLLSILIASIALFVFSNTAFASSNFNTNYLVTYSVGQSGVTHTILNVTFINKTSEYYASSYKIQVGFDNITNVAAFDSQGPINPVLEKTNEGYMINLNFNKKVTGLGEKLNFTVSFDTNDVAKQYGKIWEINIPGIANPDEFDSFTVEIKVPQSFGKPTYTKPYRPVERLVFDKKQLDKSGISISFGDKQIYSFHLTYHIKNEKLYPVKTEIALPPTTNYQNVFIQNINPAPDNVTLDKDENWLAAFTLGAAQKKDITVEGKAEILLTPKPQTLPSLDKQEYLQDRPYWQVNSSEIKRLARALKTPKAIYEFVVKTLKYDFSRVTQDKSRLGALSALKEPASAVCLEYTDLFIALARAAGIPAREVDGYAYTQNPKQRPLSLVKDILHAWPEYYDYDKKTWVMVDPTWGSTTGGVDYFTTLDFDHFAFVIKGMDSAYPVPAGGYKFLSDKYTKDVLIDFSQNAPAVDYTFDITPSFPKDVMTALPITGTIGIKNTGQTLLPAQILSLVSTTLDPHEQILRASPIPPYGSTILNASFNSEPFLTNKRAMFTIRVSDQSITKSIGISPLLIKKWGQVAEGIAIAIFTLFILIIAIKGRRL